MVVVKKNSCNFGTSAVVAREKLNKAISDKGLEIEEGIIELSSHIFTSLRKSSHSSVDKQWVQGKLHIKYKGLRVVRLQDTKDDYHAEVK